jgi:hypothetical protein
MGNGEGRFSSSAATLRLIRKARRHHRRMITKASIASSEVSHSRKRHTLPGGPSVSPRRNRTQIG